MSQRRCVRSRRSPSHDQVTHDKYGLGVILGVEDEVAVLVDFGPQQLRIPVPCAKLTKL